MRYIFLTLAYLVTACSEEKPKTADEWKMTEKTTYRTVLNQVGKPDSVYLTKYKIVNNQAIDSLQQILVYSYPNENDLTKRVFEKTPNGEYKFISSEDQLSDSKFETAKTIIRNAKGDLIRDQTMIHDSLHRLLSLKEITTTFSENSPIRYDTILVQYSHDNQGKVISAVARNGHGEIVRKDVNLYSGSNPLQSISLSQAGDTLRHTFFKIDKGTIVSSYETDSLSFRTWSKDGFVLAQLATSKYSDKKFRKVVSYANNRVTAEILYNNQK